MKLVILGGTGVFGSRLARLLARDGHEVVLATRSGAEALATELGAKSLVVDRTGDLAPLFADAPDVLVDASGPFQTYGQDPYRVAHAALAAGVNYIDLSDDAGFTLGLSSLNDEAMARGLFALSGASSVPALSAAVVQALSHDMHRIHAIDSAILPGNRAPRGRSVMVSILAQVGRPLRLWLGGNWVERAGWTDARLYSLPGGGTRRAYLNRVPDLDCFPEHFKVRTVTFRAGLELPIMGYGLALLAFVRRFWDVPVSLRLAHFGARLLEPFGTDRGGMVVSVTGETAQGVITRHWRLLAEGGDGPYVPTLAVRAIAAANGVSPGARPALDDVTLAQFEAAMADLNIQTFVEEEPTECLFAQVLGADFQGLPKPVRDSHAVYPVLRLSGEARVTRGPGLWPNLLAKVFGFPPAAEAIPVTVTKTRHGARELWERQFGSNRFRSVLTATPQGMTERFGPFTFRLDLHVTENALHFPVLAGWLGPIPLPGFALPKSETREFAQDGKMRFDVTLRAPITGAFIIRYEGVLEPLA